MSVQAKSLDRPDSKLALEVMMIGFGVVVGGLLSLVSLWLWLDHRFNGGQSLLNALGSSGLAFLPSSVQALLVREARLLGLPLAGETKAYWYMARSGGVVAYLLLWGSVVWGLVISTKITDKWVPAPLAYGLHEFLSLMTILFSVLHTVVLLGDRYINFQFIHLAVPFTAPYQPFWTGLGTISLYLVALVTASFYLRKRLGPKTWRQLHYLTFGLYGLVLLHGLMAGTDTGLGLIKLMYLLTGAIVLFLTYYRLLFKTGRI